MLTQYGKKVIYTDIFDQILNWSSFKMFCMIATLLTRHDKNRGSFSTSEAEKNVLITDDLTFELVALCNKKLSNILSTDKNILPL